MKALGFIGYLYRLLLTPLCFACFGVGSLMMVYLEMPLYAACGLLKGPLARRRHIAVRLRFFLRCLHYLGLIRIEQADLGDLSARRSTLVVANHPTLLDFPLLAAYLPDLNTVFKEGILKNPFLGRIVRECGYLSNTRAEEFLEECRRCLQSGENLMIFPEGTRTDPQVGVRLKRGAAGVAAKVNCEVAVLKIECSTEFLNRRTRWYVAPRRLPCYSVTFCGIIKARELKLSSPEGESDPRVSREINARIASMLNLPAAQA